MIIPILKYGSPELRKVSEPITEFGDELKKTAASMLESMYGSAGVGLAAPQIGINIRLITIDTSGGENKEEALVVCNPEITYSEGKQVGEEGCLSFPTFCENVARPQKVRVKWQNLEGEAVETEAEGLLARAFCHEIDHLNGVLFIDHVSSLKRNLIKNRIRKLAKAGEW
jgi:peptide deformylase